MEPSGWTKSSRRSRAVATRSTIYPELDWTGIPLTLLLDSTCPSNSVWRSPGQNSIRRCTHGSCLKKKPYRIQKSLSDLNGSDPHIHEDQVQGVMRELCNAFVRPGNQPTVPETMSAYLAVRRQLTTIIADAGAESLFEARAFRDLCFVAKGITEKVRSR